MSWAVNMAFLSKTWQILLKMQKRRARLTYFLIIVNRYFTVLGYVHHCFTCLNIFHSREFASNSDFKKNFYLKLTLPFLPPNQMEAANALIDQQHPAPSDFTEYFISQWINLKEMVSLMDNLQNRTNNIMEGFNSYLAKNYRCHLNIWLFLAKFRQEESLFFIKISQLNEGAEIATQRNNYRHRTNMILRKIARRREEDDLMDFLKQIARIFYLTR